MGLELRKQISMFVPLSDWRMLRAEAARQKIPMTELFRRWMGPGMEELRRDAAERASSSGEENIPKREAGSCRASVSGGWSNPQFRTPVAPPKMQEVFGGGVRAGLREK